MTDTVLQSFCERCGTRYTFTEPQDHMPDQPEPKRGLFGRRASEPSRPPSVSTADPSSDRFEGTFHFCLDCRQYTCANCWNEEKGACIGCRPPGAADDAATPGTRSGVLDPTRAEETAWPQGDIARAQRSGGAKPTEPSEATPTSVGSGEGSPPAALDEWGRPRAADPAPRTGGTVSEPPAAVDPWRGVVFTDDDEPTPAAPPPPRETPDGRIDFGAATTASDVGSSAWPSVDRASDRRPDTQEVPSASARETPPGTAADRDTDDEDATASRLREVMADVDASSWARASTEAARTESGAAPAPDSTEGDASTAPVPAEASPPVAGPMEASEPADEDAGTPATEAPATAASITDTTDAVDATEATAGQPEPADEPAATADGPAATADEPAATADDARTADRAATETLDAEMAVEPRAAEASTDPSPPPHESPVPEVETPFPPEPPAVAASAVAMDESGEAGEPASVDGSAPAEEPAPAAEPAPAEQPAPADGSAPAEEAASTTGSATPTEPAASDPLAAPTPPAPMIDLEERSPEPDPRSLSEPDAPASPAHIADPTPFVPQSAPLEQPPAASRPSTPDPAPPTMQPPITPVPAPSLEVWNTPATPGPFAQPYAPPSNPTPPANPPTPPGAAPEQQVAPHAPAPPAPTSGTPPMQASAQFVPPLAPSPPARQAPRAGTRACATCALPLSAKAKFCRRCGSPQA